MVFIAEGLGKQEDDTLVWDMGFAHGVATANGLRVGQHRPGGQTGRPAPHEPIKPGLTAPTTSRHSLKSEIAPGTGCGGGKASGIISGVRDIDL
jgi:hypothetical protein